MAGFSPTAGQHHGSRHLVCGLVRWALPSPPLFLCGFSGPLSSLSALRSTLHPLSLVPRAPLVPQPLRDLFIRCCLTTYWTIIRVLPVEHLQSSFFQEELVHV